MQSLDVLDQDAARLHSLEHRRGAGNANQDHVRLAREGGDARRRGEFLLQARTLTAQERRLARELAGVLEREQRRLGVERADVVGRPDLVDLVDQRRRAGEVAEPNAGEAELAERAQDEDVRERSDFGHPRPRREC